MTNECAEMCSAAERGKIGEVSAAMDGTSQLKEWKTTLWPLIQIKTDEFAQLGYGRVEDEVIWQYLVRQSERGKIEAPLRLHRLTQEVLSISVNDYMDWLRLKSLKGPDWFASGKPVRLNEFDDEQT